MGFQKGGCLREIVNYLEKSCKNSVWQRTDSDSNWLSRRWILEEDGHLQYNLHVYWKMDCQKGGASKYSVVILIEKVLWEGDLLRKMIALCKWLLWKTQSTVCNTNFSEIIGFFLPRKIISQHIWRDQFYLHYEEWSYQHLHIRYHVCPYGKQSIKLKNVIINIALKITASSMGNL